jgi:putative ABC transport system permease protein
VEQLAQDSARPPFSFLFRYLGVWHGALEWEDIQAADAYLSNQVTEDLGLPVQNVVRHVHSKKWQFHPAESGAYNEAPSPLAWLAVGFLEDVSEHIRIIEGTGLNAGIITHHRPAAVPVIATRALADELGLQVGEPYLLADPAAPQSPLIVHLTGIWEARDHNPAYWLYLPRNFDDVLLTSEEIYREVIAPRVKGEIGLAAWYLVADGRGISGGAVGRLQTRIAAVRAKLDGLLPDLVLDHSPEAALDAYQKATFQLTLRLYAFETPILGLILVFVGLVAHMAVQRQEEEIAVLRSRGGTRQDIVGLYIGQWGLLGLIALLVGGPIGWVAATLMARIRSFLQFAGHSAAWVQIEGRSWAFGLGAVLLALLAAVIPARRAASHTIVTRGQRGEGTRRPWWQRYVIDGALLLPALYGYLLLARPSWLPCSIPLAGLTQGDLFGNPLLFLVPTVFILAWAMILLRLFPQIMGTLAQLTRRLRAPVPLLICHDLSEQAQRIAGPLMLLTLTTALATFSASLARSLDIHLTTQTYYQIGADVRLVEQGETVQPEGPGGMSGGQGSTRTNESGNVEWVFLPISQHLELPGVQGATRVGNYGATVSLGGRTEIGRYLGVDRLDLPGVAYFEEGFASQSLGALLNALGAEPRGVLVDRRFLARHSLAIGDPLRLTVDVVGERIEMTTQVVGAVDYFPTLYPEDGPFFVGNLSYLFTRLGGLYPYDVWLATEPGSTEAIVRALNERGVPVISRWDARAQILDAQQRPQRQGLFGLLTLGFLAAGGLTVLGMALHALLAFRERTVELGVLRAIGLSVGQMRWYLAGTQATLLGLGLAAGTLLGTITGRLFIPFLQVDAGLHAKTPPFVVHTAWAQIGRIYVLFVVAALITIGITLILLRRMRLHEAIKLGEAV